MMQQYAEDIELVLARRHSNGGDYRVSADGRIYVGSPYSTVSSLVLLHELGVTSEHEAVRGAIDTIAAR